MSWWYPRLNAHGEIASGNGEIWINGGPLGPGHSPQWASDDEVLVDGDGEGARLVHVRTHAVQHLGFAFNPRVGNTSGISAGPGHWCGWNTTQGLVLDGHVVDQDAAPGAIDQQTGTLYYLTPYQANYKDVVRWPDTILRRGVVATEIVAGEQCCTWGEYEQVRTLYGWTPERGIERLSPLAPTELLFVGVPVATPSGRWLVVQTHAGLIVYPWGDTRGYILPGEWYAHHARYLSGMLHIVATNARGALVQQTVNLAAPRVDLTRYYPTSGTNPDPPDPEPEPEEPMNAPIVTVDRWTLSDVLDGREFVFHDGGNPDLQIAARVWVEGGVMYASLTNKHGTARTGARRPVEPCSQHPPDPVDPPDPPDPVDPPEPSDRIFLQTVHGSYLAVGPDAFLTTSSTAVAAFTVEPQGNGRHGLKVQGKYVACEPDGRLEANRDTCSEWEYFTVHEDEAGGLAFQAWTGLFISVADVGSVLANQSVIGGWETFTPSPAPPVGVGRPPITGPLSAGSGRIFYAHGGAAWRYCGVSAFPLCRRYTDGGAVAVQPFLDAFPEYTVLRVWDYVPWPGTGWASCSVEEWQAFLAFVKAQGWYVELTLLTDDDPQRIGWAQQLVLGLAGTPNLLIEIGNEPETNKHIDTRALERACNDSGLLYSSGNYENSHHWFGRFGTTHTARDSEWPRKGHDLMEYYGGGGPHAPTDPACPAPWVGDEPIRPDQCNPNWWPIEQDYQSHGAVCALLGAGCTFHFAGGRFGTLPTALEQRCAAAMIGGLTAFPPDAPNWGYARIDEEGNSLRTYVLGDRCMVRVRPTTPEAPQPGWRALDGWHQLFVR